MKRPIIGKERYEKLKKLMQGTAEDVKLVVNIVNECDMDKSLLYILALISQKYEGLATFATPLTNGKNTYKVIIGPFENLVQLNEILKIDTIQQYEDLSIFLK